MISVICALVVLALVGLALDKQGRADDELLEKLLRALPAYEKNRLT